MSDYESEYYWDEEPPAPPVEFDDDPTAYLPDDNICLACDGTGTKNGHLCKACLGTGIS